MSYGAVWRLYHEHQRCALHGAGSGPVRSLEPCSGKKCLDVGGLLELAARDDARAIAKFREDGASPQDIRAMVGLPQTTA